MKPIESFETLTLRISGMRGSCEYEILKQENQAQVSRYSIRYLAGNGTRILTQRALCEEKRVLKLLNDCALLSWDGFVGEHPRGVTDGILFNLTATVDGGRTVKANGSQNFPKHYRDFTDGLYVILSEGEEFE